MPYPTQDHAWVSSFTVLKFTVPENGAVIQKHDSKNMIHVLNFVYRTSSIDFVRRNTEDILNLKPVLRTELQFKMLR